VGTFIELPVNEIVEEQEKTSLTWEIDFENGRIANKIDGINAVKQAITKAIITPRFKCLIYDNQYGCEIKNALISGNSTPEYLKTAVENFVNDCLKPDTRIIDIGDFEFNFIDERAEIKFTAQTIFGTVAIQEVINA
jgi:hypothetical protein